MEHPHLNVLEREKFVWSLSNVVLLEDYLYVLDGDPLLEVVKSVINMYKTFVEPSRSRFRKCEYSHSSVTWICLLNHHFDTQVNINTQR